jgi:hypothetical protein
VEEKLYVRRSGEQETGRLNQKKMGHSRIEWPFSEISTAVNVTALRGDHVAEVHCVVAEVHCAAAEVHCVVAEVHCAAAEVHCAVAGAQT